MNTDVFSYLLTLSQPPAAQCNIISSIVKQNTLDMICMNHIVELCLLAKPAGDGLLHFADDSVITGLSDM